MQKKWILSSVAILSVVGMGTQVDATCSQSVYGESPTYSTMDFGRTISGIIKSATESIRDGEHGAELIAKQEENNEKAGSGSGSGGGGGSSDNEEAKEKESEVPGESEFLGSAYNFVRLEILGKEGNIGYEPIKRAVGSASAGSVRQNIYQAVIDNFFVDMNKSNQRTTEYQNQILNQRQAYVEESTNRHITFAYKVKGFIQNDLQAIPTAALSCGCELASLAINAHTLEEMVKAELVDLAMQIELMEADAIQLMMEYQSPILLGETKEATYGSASSGNTNNNGSGTGDSGNSSGDGSGTGDSGNSSGNGTGSNENSNNSSGNESGGGSEGNNSSGNGTEGGAQ